MRSVFFYIFCWFPFLIYGQEGERLEVMHQKSISLSLSDFDSAIFWLDRARDLIIKSKDSPVYLPENYWLRTRAFFLNKFPDSVMYYSEEGINLARIYNDNKNLARFHNMRGIIYKRRGDVINSIMEYQKSLSYNLISGDSSGVSKTMMNIGALHRQVGNVDSAIVYYRLSVELRHKLQDTAGLGNSYNSLASAYKSSGLYQRAFESYYVALDLYNENNENNEKLKGAMVLFNLGSLNTRLKRYSKALENYKLCLDYYQGESFKIDRSDVYLNIADVMLFTEQPDSALLYLGTSERVYSEENELSGLSSVYHGYGRAYAQLKQFEKARGYFDRAIDIKKQIGEDDIVGYVHNSYGVAMYNSGELPLSLREYQKSLGIGERFKKPDLVRASLLGLSEVNDALGNDKLAYNYRLQYEFVKDSLDNVQKSRQIAELREIYESEQKDKQITQLELENEVINAQSEANAAQVAKQRADKLTLIVVAVTLLVLTVVVYFYLKQRLAIARLKEKEEKEAHIKSVNELLVQQQTKTLEAMVQGQEQERLRIAKELHDHFGSLMAAVKVNLTTVSAKSKTGVEDDKQMKSLSLLVDQACEDIRSLSHSMHVGISESFGLVPALKDLADSVTASGRVEVAFHSASCADQLDSAIEVTVYRLVQELVSNALKHADATKLTIQLTCLGDIVNVIVEDNGKGFDARYYMTQSEGMGLKSMQERIDSLQGEFEVDSRSGKGTTVIIDLPASMEPKMTSI